MNCITCGTEMEIYSDQKYLYTKLEWLKCPKCDSQAEITDSKEDGSIIAMNWCKFEVKYSMKP